MSEAFLHGGLMLGLSIAALWLGPLLHRLADRADRAFALLDGFVVVAVLGLALLHIIPEAVSEAGWLAIVAVLAGLVLPRLAEPRWGGQSTHRFAAWLAFSGMALHALTDGLALAGTHLHGSSHALEWAVILHRVPVGLAIAWMLIQPASDTADEPGVRAARRAVLVALVTISVTTAVGFGFGGVVELDGPWLGAFEAFVGGLLLHVVSHGIGHAEPEPEPEVEPRAPAGGSCGSGCADSCGTKPPPRPGLARYLPGLGGLVGLGFVLALFVVPELDDPDGHGRASVDAFWDLVLDSAPALLLGFGLAGLVGSVMGEAPARWLRRGSKAGQAVRGVAFGLPLPLCSCGVVPVYRSLVARGVPATAALGFLLATPELGLDAVLISLPLLGLELAAVRVVVAFVLALAVGWLVGSWADRRSPGRAPAQPEGVEGEPAPLPARLREGLRIGYGEVLDTTGPWILVGLVVAAFVEPWLDTESLTRLGPAVQVLAFALVGLPVYVCATGATPLVAVLIAKGLSPGAALAFLLTGPATNATTFGLLEQLHGRKVALAFTGAVIGSVVVLGIAINLTWPELGAGAVGGHEHGEQRWLGLASAAVMAALFAASLVRQGPRGFLGRLWEHGGHDHDHGDGHDHDHGHGHGHGHDHDHDHGHGHGHGHAHAHDH